MAIFHSYAKLPEGTSSMAIPGSWISHMLTMVLKCLPTKLADFEVKNRGKSTSTMVRIWDMDHHQFSWINLKIRDFCEGHQPGSRVTFSSCAWSVRRPWLWDDRNCKCWASIIWGFGATYISIGNHGEYREIISTFSLGCLSGYKSWSTLQMSKPSTSPWTSIP